MKWNERNGPRPPANFEFKDAPASFACVWSKARDFMYMGAARYRKRDVLGHPQASWGEDRVARVSEGCRQIVQGGGRHRQAPLRGLDRTAMGDLLATFHFVMREPDTCVVGVIEVLGDHRVLEWETVSLYVERESIAPR